MLSAKLTAAPPRKAKVDGADGEKKEITLTFDLLHGRLVLYDKKMLRFRAGTLEAAVWGAFAVLGEDDEPGEVVFPSSPLKVGGKTGVFQIIYRSPRDREMRAVFYENSSSSITEPLSRALEGSTGCEVLPQVLEEAKEGFGLWIKAWQKPEARPRRVRESEAAAAGAPAAAAAAGAPASPSEPPPPPPPPKRAAKSAAKGAAKAPRKKKQRAASPPPPPPEDEEDDDDEEEEEEEEEEDEEQPGRSLCAPPRVSHRAPPAARLALRASLCARASHGDKNPCAGARARSLARALALALARLRRSLSRALALSLSLPRASFTIWSWDLSGHLFLGSLTWSVGARARGGAAAGGRRRGGGGGAAARHDGGGGGDSLARDARRLVERQTSTLTRSLARSLARALVPLASRHSTLASRLAPSPRALS